MNEERAKTRKLRIAVNHMDVLYYRALRSLGTRDNAFFILYALADGKAYSQKEISEEWFISRTTLNTIVKEYVRQGYVTLRSSGHKEKQIVLTEAGRVYAERILRPIFSAEERAFADLSESAIEEIAALVARIEIEFNKEFGKTDKDR